MQPNDVHAQVFFFFFFAKIKNVLVGSHCGVLSGSKRNELEKGLWSLFANIFSRHQIKANL